jgi:cell division GTPase FtsZ
MHILALLICVLITTCDYLIEQEINAAAEVIYQNVDPNANIIFGALVDDAMGDNMVVTGTI